jgi:phage gp29-like protein
MIWLTDMFTKTKPPKPAKDVQTERAELSFLPTEFSDHPGSNLTPKRAAALLLEAEQGNLKALAELADDMEERDTHLFAELSKRRRACLGKEWMLELPNPDRNEQKALEQLTEWLQNFPLDDTLLGMTDAIHKGYSNSELIWEQVEKVWLPTTVEHRPANWFTADPKARDVILLRSQSGAGTPLQELSWIQHIHKARSGYLTNTALARVTIWPFLFRHYSSRDLAEFLEVYGIPMRLGQYPAGATTEERNTLLRAVSAIGHNAAGIIPSGMAIEFQQAAQGQADPFMAMIKWAEGSISKAVLGGTLTSESDGKGSYAMADVHDDVRLEIRSSDLKLLAATLTRDIIRPITLLNTPLKRVPKFILDDSEPEDMALYSEALPKLARLMPIPTSWVYRKLKIPVPTKDEPVLKASISLETAANKTTQSGCSCCSPQPVAALKLTDQKDLGEAIISTTPSDTTLQQQAEAMIQPLLEIAAKGLDDGLDSEAILQAMLTAYNDMDSSLLETALTQSIFMAELAGRWEAQQEQSDE